MARERDRRRAMIVAMIVAVVLGFLLGWFSRIWTEPTPESRARHRLDEIRERVRGFTR